METPLTLADISNHIDSLQIDARLKFLFSKVLQIEPTERPNIFELIAIKV